MFDITQYNQETQIATFTLEFAKRYSVQARNFYKNYKQENIIILVGNKKNLLKKKTNRKCRFCNKSFPDVTFKHKAHLIPNLLGNEFLLSDFECDNCNKVFSRYENELSYFLGLNRTLTKFSGKKGIPKFVSPNKEFKLVNYDKKDLLFIESEKGKYVTIDEENNETRITTTAHSYNNLMVYKCLVKIGMSLIPKQQILNYEECKEFLISNHKTLSNSNFATVYQYMIPGPFYNYPVLFMFQKENNINNEKLPQKTFVLYLKNIMLQFSIPFCSLDSYLNKKTVDIDRLLLPPLIPQAHLDKYGVPQLYQIDLKDDLKTIGRTETYILKAELDNAL